MLDAGSNLRRARRGRSPEHPLLVKWRREQHCSPALQVTGTGHPELSGTPEARFSSSRTGLRPSGQLSAAPGLKRKSGYLVERGNLETSEKRVAPRVTASPTGSRLKSSAQSRGAPGRAELTQTH